MKTDQQTEPRTSPLRLFAMAMLPVLLLAAGAAGYGWLTGRLGAGKAEGVSAPAPHHARRGPRGPRYGRGGANWRTRGRRTTAPLVEIRRVELSEWRPRMRFYGRIIAPHRVGLRMPVSGRIVMVNPRLRPGGEVKKGEILVRLDDFAYRAALAQAEAALEEARAKARESEAQIALEEASLKNARRQLELARRDLARVRELAGTGAASGKALDAAILTETQRRLAVTQKKGAIGAARARLAQYRAQIRRQRELVKLARRDLADTVLEAPFDARVLSAQAETGQYVTPSSELALLADKGRLEARFSMSEDQYGDLLALGGSLRGAPVRIIWKSGHTRLALPGRLERIAPEVDAASGAVTAFASIGAGDDLLRKTPIGSFVDVMLAAPRARKVARLPEGALHDGGQVFIIRDGVLRPRKVRALARDGGEIIIAGGLETGEEVMISPLPNARAGMRVRTVKQ